MFSFFVMYLENKVIFVKWKLGKLDDVKKQIVKFNFDRVII